MGNVIKAFDSYGKHRHTFILSGSEENRQAALEEAQKWCYEGCRLEKWATYNYAPDEKVADLPTEAHD